MSTTESLNLATRDCCFLSVSSLRNAKAPLPIYNESTNTQYRWFVDVLQFEARDFHIFSISIAFSFIFCVAAQKRSSPRRRRNPCRSNTPSHATLNFTVFLTPENRAHNQNRCCFHHSLTCPSGHSLHILPCFGRSLYALLGLRMITRALYIPKMGSFIQLVLQCGLEEWFDVCSFAAYR